MKENERREELIAQVFAGLREVTPPMGMEERLLHAVEQREAAPARGRRLSASVEQRLRIGVGAGVAFAAAGLVMFLLLPMAKTRPSQPALRQHAAVAASAPAVPALTQDARVETVTRGTGQTQLRRAHFAHMLHKLPVQDLAAEEASAPSVPAPSMPLTTSERLLQQAARRGRSRADSPLNPEVRARERMQAAMEFTDFFTPPAKAGDE